MIRSIVNFVIAAGWLCLFSQLHWITVLSSERPLWVTLALTVLVMWGVGVLVDLAYGALRLFTCGCASVFYFPMLLAQGWIVLKLTEHYTHWYTVNEGLWWIGLLMSVLIGLVRWHPSRNSSSSDSQES